MAIVLREIQECTTERRRHRKVQQQQLTGLFLLVLGSLLAMVGLGTSALGWSLLGIGSLVTGLLILLDCRVASHEAGFRGKEAERGVARTLGELPDSYLLLHNLRVGTPHHSRMEIDHVVIGPNGVFCLETKVQANDASPWFERIWQDRFEQCLAHEELVKEKMQPVLDYVEDRLHSILVLTHMSGDELPIHHPRIVVLDPHHLVRRIREWETVQPLADDETWEVASALLRA